MSERIVQELAITYELAGQDISPQALVAMAEELQQHNEPEVLAALKIARRHTGRLSFGVIADALSSQDGRPSPDQAWAEFPKSEAESAVVSDEMSSAWYACREQYENGDIVGASIAFKREYKLLCSQARAESVKPRWFPSLGFSSDGDGQAIAAGVEQGRLSMSHAKKLLQNQPDQLALLENRVAPKGVSSDQIIRIAREKAA